MFNNKKMNSQLDSIVSSSRLPKYIIKYTLPNGDQKFAKMRWLRYTKKSVYLRCSNVICNTKIIIKIVSPDLIVSNGPKRFKLSEEATDDDVLNKDNYGATEHK